MKLFFVLLASLALAWHRAEAIGASESLVDSLVRARKSDFIMFGCALSWAEQEHEQQRQELVVTKMTLEGLANTFNGGAPVTQPVTNTGWLVHALESVPSLLSSSSNADTIKDTPCSASSHVLLHAAATQALTPVPQPPVTPDTDNDDDDSNNEEQWCHLRHSWLNNSEICSSLEADSQLPCTGHFRVCRTVRAAVHCTCHHSWQLPEP